MGGKGGGGGGGGPTMDQMGYVWDDSAPTVGGTTGGWLTQAQYDAAHPKAAAAPEPAAPAPAPEAPAPEPEAPAPEAPAPIEPLGAAVGSGGFIDQPDGAKSPFGQGSMTDTGEVLGGSVLNPPNYWTGGTTKKSGSQTTTQT